MKFKCPTCDMSLKAEPDMAGKIVRCPGCNTKIQIPAIVTDTGYVPPPPTGLSSFAANQQHSDYTPERPQRVAWKETDPTNPNGFVAFGCGLAITLVIFGMVYPFIAPSTVPVAEYNTMQWFANLLFKHFTISFLNVTFFCWAMSIVYMKIQKLRHQKEALLLDVLPMELGQEINSQNVGTFIDHVYNLPNRLRDSLMVNRIRKALELFEIKTNVADVSHAMDSQSNIDSARIGASYILLKAFLWAIPLLGFIGTVVGLSHAIGGMNFSNVSDTSKIVESINGVTSGLGTAFDATLLGLVLAVLLNFPLNSLSKSEDEMLNNIDSFCNEVLLPRLSDGSGAGGGDTAAIADSVIKGLSSAQREFLTDLNELSKRMNDYATNLDRRSDAFQAAVTREFVTNMTTMRTEVEGSIRDSMKMTSQYMAALETGIRSLNIALKELGQNQIVVQQAPKKKGWFSRS